MSDIFNEYARIMEQNGFVKKAEERKPIAEDKEYQDKIKALYNLNITLNDSDKPIVEQAHPEKVIIAPSYDKLNGLVENIQDRHNVMVGIVNKCPNGNLTNHKYAHQDLVDELIKISFDLDNQGKTELSKQALECAQGITKEAYFGWLVPVLKSPAFWKTVATIPLWAGIKTQFFGYIDQGVKADTERAISSLTELSSEVSGSNKAILAKYIRVLQAFQEKIDSALEIMARTDNNIEHLTGPEDVMKVKQQIVGTKEEYALVQQFLKDCVYLRNVIGKGGMNRLTGNTPGTMINTISNMTESEDSATSDLWKSVKWVWKEVAGDDTQDSVNALISLSNSIEALLQEYQTNMRKLPEAAQEQGEAAMENFKKTQTQEQTKSNELSDYVKI